MDLAYREKSPGRRMIGFGAVVVLHALIVYALLTGLARKAVEVIKKPLNASIIEEIKPPPPPPPPPPPKVVKQIDTPKPPAAPPPPYVPPPEITPQVTQNVISNVTNTPPPEPPVIAPPPPPAPPAVQRGGDIGVVCPTQVKPEIPRKALQEGTSGVVKARVLVSNGVVKDVTILSGPRVFHAAVRAAVMQYKCQSSGGDVIAEQEFEFKID
jgi:protein TonB